ncbi:MAG: hypothetical protein QOH88_3025 [Verrucomicrobiota bacterium]|jgi:hypothetical protein
MSRLSLALIVFLPIAAFAETRGIEQATREGLVGVWEALAQDQSMGTGVYQMIIPKEGDAVLLQLVAVGESGSYLIWWPRPTNLNHDYGVNHAEA